MKISCTKGLDAAGLLLLTFQILVHLFEYIVNVGDFIGFFVHTWAGVLGYGLLVALFVKNKIGRDFILTLIGALLWIAQFYQTFLSLQSEPLTAFIYCAAGILGVAFVLVSLVMQTIADKKNKS